MIQVDNNEPLISRSAAARLRTNAVRPKLRLFCLAQAGCDAGCFHPWQDRLLPHDVEVLPIELPGRGQRFKEDAGDLSSIRALVQREILPKISKLLPREDHHELPSRRGTQTFEEHHEWTNPPYAIFGHSMGALVAYEMCVQIEARSRSDDWAWAKPQALYVCGMRAPSLCGPAHDPDQKNPTLSELDGSDFWAAFERRYGANPDLNKNTEIKDRILPKLKRDFAMMETYDASGFADYKLNTRTCVIRAAGDDRTPKALTDAWHEHVAPGYVVQTPVFKGVSPANEASGTYWGTPHRIVLDYPDEILAFLKKDLPSLFKIALLPSESDDPRVNDKEMMKELEMMYGDFTAWDLTYPPPDVGVP